jgi:hypothetical protein
MKFLKPFSTFINESRYGGQHGYDTVAKLSDEFGRQLDEFGAEFNEPITNVISEFESLVEELTNTRQYWYNRESRNIQKDHYAVSVKVYAYPDLEEFQATVGPEMEVDDDDLENEWMRWMQMEIEDFESLFLDKFSAFDEIRWGGKSGGWICPVPDESPDGMVDELRDLFQDYLRYFEDADEEELQSLQDWTAFSEEERSRLGDIGITDSGYIQNVTSERDDLVAQIERKIEALQEQKAGLDFIIEKHAEFEKTAKQNFLNYVEESQ